MNFYFANPLFLFLLLPLLFITWKQWRQKFYATLWQLPHSSLLHATLLSPKMKWAKWASLLVPMALACMIVALARPQQPLREEMIQQQGIDIVMALDLSLSMLATDFSPNRLEVAKDMAATFVQQRRFDRLGLVVFSGEALTQIPLTSDHAIMLEALKNLKSGELKDGTAIGMGLATAVNRLKESKSKSKVVILLTDGENNVGYISPEIAAELAKSLGIRVYTIGVGSNGLAMMPDARLPDGTPHFSLGQVTIDEATLTHIADFSNGGRYFRAHDKEELAKIYDEINTLEKTLIDTQSIKRKVELFPPLVTVALCCLTLYFILQQTLFKGLLDRF
jgi:Ca-activated chloride channel homolog